MSVFGTATTAAQSGDDEIESPLAAFEALSKVLSETPGKKDKEEILGRIIVGEGTPALLRDLFRRTYSPFITYGISLKQLPETANDTKLVSGDWSARFTITLSILDKLASRDLTGNDAKDAISHLFRALTVTEEAAVRKIIAKDFRAGVTGNTVNKVVKGTVPKFDCQLAQSKMPDVNDLKYPVIVEPKYDGVRCLALKRNGDVQLLSRTGKPYENFAEINQYLTDYMPDNTVFDGEILHLTELGDDGFAKVMKRAKAKLGKNVEGNEVRFQVFDVVTLRDWDFQKCTDLQDARRECLQELISAMPDNPLCSIAPSHVANDVKALMELYNGYVDDGFEGIIIKEIKGKYTFKRNKTWMKLKPFDTVDLEVVSVTEGEGKYEGMLGTLVCEGAHDGKDISVEVGSGYSDAQRKELFEQWPIGDIAEIRYQDITLAEDSKTHSLRFPTFVRFRGNSDGEKI